MLATGKNACLTIKSDMPEELSRITVQINEINYKPDVNGRIAFPVPDEENFSVDIVDEQGHLIKRYSYYKVAGNILCHDPELGKFFLRLHDLKENQKHRGPYVFFAPTIAEVGESIVILGNNFSGKLNGNKLTIGNREAEIFACSPYALVGKVPSNAALGPVQELCVKADGEASNGTEIDVCRLSFQLPSPLPQEEALALPVKVLGSNLPALLDVKVEGLLLTSMSGKDSNHETYITTGGENNLAIVAIRTPPASCPAIFLPHLLTNLPAAVFLSNDSSNLWQASGKLCQAQIIRLKRRLINIEQKLAETRLKRDEAADTAELERLSAAIKALSLRKEQLQEMLMARHELFLSLQYTEEDYQATIDEATGGAYFTVENSIQPVKLPDIDLSLLGKISPRPTGKKNRYTVLPVPRIKLWIPIDLDIFSDAGPQPPELGKSVEPATSQEPAASTEPITSTELATPAEPATLPQPAKSTELATPAEPATLPQPAKSTELATPAEPATLPQPAKSTEPLKPTEPATPAEPAKSTEPLKPAASATPAEKTAGKTAKSSPASTSAAVSKPNIVKQPKSAATMPKPPVSSKYGKKTTKHSVPHQHISTKQVKRKTHHSSARHR